VFWHGAQYAVQWLAVGRLYHVRHGVFSKPLELPYQPSRFRGLLGAVPVSPVGVAGSRQWRLPAVKFAASVPHGWTLAECSTTRFCATTWGRSS